MSITSYFMVVPKDSKDRRDAKNKDTSEVVRGIGRGAGSSRGTRSSRGTSRGGGPSSSRNRARNDEAGSSRWGIGRTLGAREAKGKGKERAGDIENGRHESYPDTKAPRRNHTNSSFSSSNINANPDTTKYRNNSHPRYEHLKLIAEDTIAAVMCGHYTVDGEDGEETEFELKAGMDEMIAGTEYWSPDAVELDSPPALQERNDEKGKRRMKIDVLEISTLQGLAYLHALLESNQESTTRATTNDTPTTSTTTSPYFSNPLPASNSNSTSNTESSTSSGPSQSSLKVLNSLSSADQTFSNPLSTASAAHSSPPSSSPPNTKPTTNASSSLPSPTKPAPKPKIGLLNFASAHKPGGGFLSGASAQEESLARSGTLYWSLISKEGAKYYDAYKELYKGKDTKDSKRGGKDGKGLKRERGSASEMDIEKSNRKRARRSRRDRSRETDSGRDEEDTEFEEDSTESGSPSERNFDDSSSTSTSVSASKDLPSLSSYKLEPAFNTHAMIYTPSATFFRTDAGEWVRPVQAEVINCAAVDWVGVERNVNRKERERREKRRGSGKRERTEKKGKGKQREESVGLDIDPEMDFEPEEVIMNDSTSVTASVASIDVKSTSSVLLSSARPERGSELGSPAPDTLQSLRTHTEILTRIRMHRILALFAHHGVRHLILGAFGTGVFGCDVQMVARAWRELLVNKDGEAKTDEDGENEEGVNRDAPFSHAFDHVVFAVLGRDTCRVFENVFGDVVGR